MLSLSTVLPPFSLSKTLPLLGLISSTGFVTYAYSEFASFIPLLDERIPEHVIRTTWERSFPIGLPAILTMGVLSLVGGVAGYKMSQPGSTAAALYAAGTTLSMLHFTFVPLIANTIAPMLQPDSPEKPKEKRDNMSKWLRIHTVRTLVSNIPAFFCFLGATSAYFNP